MSHVENYCQTTYQLSLLDFLKLKAKEGLTATDIAHLLQASPSYIAKKTKQHQIKLIKKKPTRHQLFSIKTK